MMRALSRDAQKITMKINTQYHEPEELVVLFSELTGKEENHIMSKIWEAFCMVLFGATGTIGILSSALYYAGLWAMFLKSGLKGWWALIPGAREYQLARCAGREPEGRVYSVTSAALTVIGSAPG